MEIEVWVRDLEVADKNESNENLGIKASKGEEYLLVPLNCCRNKIVGFWYDENYDAETESIDIAFYLDGCYFRTPYTKQKLAMFEDIIKENENA